FNEGGGGGYMVRVDETTLPADFHPTPCKVGDPALDNNCSPDSVNLPQDSTSDITIDFGYNCGCSDTDACTDDRCDSELGCVHTPTNCNDNDPCTDDSCDTVTGCKHTPVNTDDHNACTDDSCDTSNGVVNAPINCDDGDPCTTDGCNPQTGCTHDPVSTDDNNACTTDSCDRDG